MTSVTSTALLLVMQLSSLRAQYIRHTLCAQLYGGRCQTECGSLMSEQPILSLCTVGVCCQQATPEWGSWGDWGSCSVSCGSGLRFRYRTCPGNRCFGPRFDRQACYNNCSITAAATSTTATTSTSTTTIITRTTTTTTAPTTSTTTAAATTSAAAASTTTGTTAVTTTPSTVSSSWASWSEWESCSTTCGIGVRLRRRVCEGQGCIGPSNDIDFCISGDCPTTSASTWSPWTEWGSCFPPCGMGVRLRIRECDGQGCIGLRTDLDICNNGDCPPDIRSLSPGRGDSAGIV